MTYDQENFLIRQFAESINKMWKGDLPEQDIEMLRNVADSQITTGKLAPSFKQRFEELEKRVDRLERTRSPESFVFKTYDGSLVRIDPADVVSVRILTDLVQFGPASLVSVPGDFHYAWVESRGQTHGVRLFEGTKAECERFVDWFEQKLGGALRYSEKRELGTTSVTESDTVTG